MGSLTYYVSKCLNISQDGKGSFTYYVISRGGFQMLTVDYGGWGLAVDYGIKILIFTLKNNTDYKSNRICEIKVVTTLVPSVTCFDRHVTK